MTSAYLERPLRTIEQAEADRWHRRRRCYRCGYSLTYLDSLCCVCKWIAAGRPPPKSVPRTYPTAPRLWADAAANGIDGSHRNDVFETDYD